MELAHALRDLLGCPWLPQLLGRQRCSVEVLLKATVGKGSKQAWPNLLAGEPLQDLELAIAVDEVLDVRAVDAEEQLRGLLLGDVLRGLGQVFGRRDDVHGIGESSTHPLHGDVLARVERDASPTLQS